MIRSFIKIIFAICLLTLSGCGMQESARSNPDMIETASETPQTTAEYSSPKQESGLTDAMQENNLQLTLNLGTGRGYPISDTLFGIFLEDINHAIDGGLYAELIKNRSFEYGDNAAWGNLHGWQTTSDEVELVIIDGSEDGTSLDIMCGNRTQNDAASMNPHYARIINNSPDNGYGGIYGMGFLQGMSVEKGDSFILSFYMRGRGDVRVTLENGTSGEILAETYLDTYSGEAELWHYYETTLIPQASCERETILSISILPGTADIDMVSLMPEDTWAELPVRKDLGILLEELHPAFLRFPGGCVVEGRNESTIYSWKDSIGDGRILTVDGRTSVGDVAIRPQGESIWKGSTSYPSYTTYGLGFYEYFCMSEALGAVPVPVLNAGMTCPIQSQKYMVYSTDSDEFRQCIQDALDLAEFCRGDAATKWGAVRIAMGHEEPFDLPWIAIGNEQWQTEYYEHYTAFVEAFDRAAALDPGIYGDVRLIVANGPSSGSTEGWIYIRKAETDTRTALVDEHYYEAPVWFLHNTERYDDYPRNDRAKVFLGEYAAQSNTLHAALAEAAYMTGLERNGDIVRMATYAPLIGNGRNNQWEPDLLFYNSETSFGTVDYYVQQMFMMNTGIKYIPSELDNAGMVDINKDLYISVVETINDDLVIKLVNTTDQELSIRIYSDFKDDGHGRTSGTDLSSYVGMVTRTVLTGDSLSDKNSFNAPEYITPATDEITQEDITETGILLPARSVTVLRFNGEG